MSLLFNLRHLEDKNLRLQGRLGAAELELETLDELIHVGEPLVYDVEVQQLDGSILVQGRLTLALDCECVRCLKPHRRMIDLGDWACHLPLEGEEKVSVVNDCVDLTPYIREDIVLAFPQHPLCSPDCGGLASVAKKAGKNSAAPKQSEPVASAWAELDKLKL